MLRTDTFLFDGAFGTYYTTLTGDTQACELANISNPDIVYSIHAQYIEAGVDAIKTNTFGANTALGIDDDTLEHILIQGYKIAQDAAQKADREVAVYADIGPIAYSEESNLSPEQEYIKIADIFLRLGADKFLFETMAEFDSIKSAIAHIKKHNPNANIIVSFAVGQDGYTKGGYYFKQLLSQASKNPYTDAVGLNCICGPSRMQELVQMYRPSKRLCIMPNSSYPENVGNRTIYLDNGEYFGEKLLALRRCGVDMLGGCCGTTPAHLKAAYFALQHFDGVLSEAIYNEINNSYGDSHKSELEKKLMAGKKIIAVELEAPDSLDLEYINNSAHLLKASGADLITVADSPLARSKADSIMTASIIKRRAGIDVLPHLTCRDKNIISIKAGLIAGKLDGVDNVFVITGDPIVATDRTSVKGVYDFNSIRLINYINILNQNTFEQSPYFVGAALNTNAANFEYELIRAQKKIEAGAKFFMTQPIFSEENIANVMLAKKELGVYIFSGVMALANYKNAVFLNNEVSGISIPENIIQELKDKDTEQAREISLNYAKQLIERLMPISDGLYLITQLKRTKLVAELVRYLANFK